MKQSKLFLFALAASLVLACGITKTHAQTGRQRTITGIVTSKTDNQPMAGVSVWLKNSSIGISTNPEGRYSINVDGIGGVLVFNFLGYETQEIAIGSETTINVEMVEDSQVIDQVVVVGYGSQQKASVVGAISTVDVSNLKVPGANLSSNLAGQLAGIVAMNRSGEPGRAGAAEFYIRGVASFAGGNSPLVLVDGIERDLDLVDVNDIEAFSILKDASASAVYGVRGANGVILITTKKGALGRPQISVRAEAGITQPTRLPKFIDAVDWANMYNEVRPGYYSEEDINRYRTHSDPDLYPNVNWLDEVFRNFASNQRVNVNVSGGGDVARYYVAGGFYNEGSIYKNAGDRYDYNSSINYKKFNFRANMDFNLTKTTILNVNLANIYETSFSPGESRDRIWTHAIGTSPNAFPVVYSDGTLSAPSIQGAENPWNLMVHSGYTETSHNSAQSLVGLTQDLSMVTPGLTGNVKFSWDAVNQLTQTRQKTPNQYHATERDADGNLIFGTPIYRGDDQLGFTESGGNSNSSGSTTTYLEASFNYDRTFGDHRIGALFLYNHKIWRRQFTGSKTLSLPYKNQGIAGRLTYSFKNTYFAEFNMGYNGSENFAPGHRFGFFPAGAVGWMISNEPFWASLYNTIDMFKIKGSYGVVGNDNISGSRNNRWIYQSTIENTSGFQYGPTNNLGSSVGIITGNVENPNVSWEKAYKTNIGLELSIFRRLRIQADYFYEKREGVFVDRGTLPRIVGLSYIPKVNVGKSTNRGVDATLEYDQQVGEVFLTARGNFTYNRNKLVDADKVSELYPYQNIQGKPFYDYSGHPFGLVALGLFQSEEEIAQSPTQTFGTYRVGDVKYQDINGDGVIDAYDRVALGYTLAPEINYGVGLTAQWKGLDLNIFFQGVAHTSFFMSGRSVQTLDIGNPTQASLHQGIWDNMWKTTNTAQENMNAKYPRTSFGGEAGSSNNSQRSTVYLENGSFLRLKNVEVGYTLPKRITDKMFMSQMRVFVAANNLATFSSFKMWDPETINLTTNGGRYPPLRIFTAGLSIQF